VAVEVATCSVVVLCGAWVGVAGEDLGIAKGDAGIECVGDGCMAKGVWADVSGDPRGASDALNHPVDVATVDRVACEWAQDQWPFDALPAAGLKLAQDRGW